MKNVINKVLFFILAAVLFASCDKNDIVTYDGPAIASFTGGKSVNAFVKDGEDGSFQIEVGVTSVSNVDRTYNVVVDPSSTATPDQYTIESTVVIPANEYLGYVTVTPNFENASTTGSTLVLNLQSDGSGEVGFQDTFTANIFKQCDSDLAGTYSVLTSGQSTDGAAAAPVVDLAYTVTLTKTGEITYSVSDIFAGIYIDWYCAPYGYCVETKQTITDVCGKISGTFTEPYGTTAVVTGTDNGDGTLTISFSNGYGDTATSVYTKM